MDERPHLNEREEQILHAVVHSYITTAEPVGSRTVVKRFDLGISPATVRNVMADLEEAGFLTQLHTSSGRVPTDFGYRYYVDYLMRVQALTLQERSQIEEELARKINDADDVLRQTSHLLALVSHQTGIAEAPGQGSVEVQRIELLALQSHRLAVLIVDTMGRVHTLPVQTDMDLQPGMMQQLCNFLNVHLRGVTLDTLVPSLQEKMQSFLDEQRGLAEQALRLIQLLPAHRGSQLFLEGATQLFEQPEFKDVAEAQRVFGLLGEEDRLLEVLREAVQGQPRTTIIIGGEGHEGDLDGISVVASPYQVEGRPMGMIGVLGPRRMHYSRLTALVDYTADAVGRILGHLGR